MLQSSHWRRGAIDHDRAVDRAQRRARRHQRLGRPARQAFTVNDREPRRQSNAIALSSSTVHAARSGLAVAGILIYLVGEGYRFLSTGSAFSRCSPRWGHADRARGNRHLGPAPASLWEGWRLRLSADSHLARQVADQPDVDVES
jgi:hypothetical protein